jgi:hypothetical protein
MVTRLIAYIYSQTGCSLASNIAILSHNIATLIGRLLWAICNRREKIVEKVKIHKRFVNKASDWTIRKREAPIQLLKTLIGFPLSYSPSRGFVYKSFVNFNLQFVRVGCKLLRTICLSKLQYCGTILQCCARKRTSGLTVEQVPPQWCLRLIKPRRLDTEIKVVIWFKLVAISIQLYLLLYIIANIFT